MNCLSLAILGVIVGHPATGNWKDSTVWDEYDILFDEWEYRLGWVEWKGVPS